jgi:hypothetical protein
MGINQSTVASFYPDDPGHGVTREQFTKLISARDLAKIEHEIGLKERPNEGFRQSVISQLWAFYYNSLPDVAATQVSRRALKKELENATKLASELEKSAAKIWSSGDWAVITQL